MVTIRYVTIELKKYEIAVPSRISVAGVMRIFSDSTMMIIAGIRAPKNAFTTIPSSLLTVEKDTPITMADTAPKHAPDEIPVLYGSASGLTMRDCMRTPHEASDAPAMIAAMM